MIPQLKSKWWNIRDQKKRLAEKDKAISKPLKTVESHKDGLSKVNDKYTDVVNIPECQKWKSIIKLKRNLENYLKEIEKEKEELRNEIADKTKLLKIYHLENVNKQLDETKEQKIDTLKDTVKITLTIC